MRGAPFFEVSALTQKNLKQAFDCIISAFNSNFLLLICQKVTGLAGRDAFSSKKKTRTCSLVLVGPPSANEKPKGMHTDSVFSFQLKFYKI